MKINNLLDYFEISDLANQPLPVTFNRTKDTGKTSLSPLLNDPELILMDERLLRLILILPIRL